MSFGDGFIDRSLYELDEELTKIDELLSDAKLLKPFEEAFDPTLGRPGTAVGIYLRMMYLKFRWGLSYEEVEKEVRERLPWRYFCHLSLMDEVPDATTLIKLNGRFGEDRITGLNQRLVKQLVKTRSIKPRRIRIDSTTIEAHISYPNDVGVLHQAVKTLTRTAASLGQRIRSHVRATKRALFNWSQTAKANPKERQEKGKGILKKVAQLATDSLKQSRQVFQSLSGSASNQSQSAKLTKSLGEQIDLAQTLLEQTQQKLQGEKSIADRIVSFHDPQARPIRKGKLNKAVEFGRTLQLVQDSSGIILHYEVHQGNPNGAWQSGYQASRHSESGSVGARKTKDINKRSGFGNCNVFAAASKGRLVCLNASSGWDESWRKGLKPARSGPVSLFSPTTCGSELD